MNLCRTCKYWAKKDDMIGVGHCNNVYARVKVILLNDLFMTAQNFGCVLHTTGEKTPSIYPPNEEARILNEYKTFITA